ncbi:hypothetical protein [Chryseolinea lacunae]|uniref:DUF5723 domain-containing protein n=1 Tax=Chryseolinea lacunae TaxID=2801331 RepID=A0ABS1L1B0_9BACT|nr:hypothetical protein [Chryseolinea lacunae]MBL0745485.1 hypothetical protein [Chryseolinea lacunae]
MMYSKKRISPGVPWSFFVTMLIFFLADSACVWAQETEGAKDFRQTRRTDFTTLLGGFQEGVSLSYNTDKTVVEGKGGFQPKGWNGTFFQVGGNVGTTTNLSAVFDQKALPVFSLNGTVNFLLGPSRWFYDGTYTANFDELEKGNFSLNTNSTKFEYKEAFAKKVAGKSFSKTDVAYTFKRLFWLSVTAKHDNAKYSFYDANAAFANQITEQAYASWSGKLTLSGYFFWNKEDFRWKPFRPNFIYVNMGLQRGRGNNISQLTKKTIYDIESTQVDPATNTTRVVVKPQTAYPNAYKQFMTNTLSFETIVAPIRAVALNVFGEYNFIDKADRDAFKMANFGSLAAGIYYYGFGNTAKVNLGVYYKWTWTNDADNSKAELWGLKTSIPITPLK